MWLTRRHRGQQAMPYFMACPGGYRASEMSGFRAVGFEVLRFRVEGFIVLRF